MRHQFVVTLEVLVCAQCGVYFGVPDYYVVSRGVDGREFYCPNGHAIKLPKRKRESLDENDQDLSADSCVLHSK